MKKIIFYCIIFTSFTDCSRKSKNELNVFKSTYLGFEQSNRITSNATQILYLSSKDRLSRPASSEKQKILQPKIDSIEMLTKQMTTYIDALKNDLKKEAGVVNLNTGETFQEGNFRAVEKLFKTNNKGEELFKKLLQFKADILNLDDRILNQFKNNTIIVSKELDAENDGNKFNDTYFNDVPVIAAMAMLSRLENNVLVLENNTVLFCDNSLVEDVVIKDDFIQPLILASTTKVKPGETINITAGIGVFATGIQREIFIDNKKMQQSENGVVNYSLISSNITGEHKVPIKLIYTDENGFKQEIQQLFFYTVAE